MSGRERTSVRDRSEQNSNHLDWRRNDCQLDWRSPRLAVTSIGQSPRLVTSIGGRTAAKRQTGGETTVTSIGRRNDCHLDWRSPRLVSSIGRWNFMKQSAPAPAKYLLELSSSETKNKAMDAAATTNIKFRKVRE